MLLDTIREIQETTELSAEVRNVLHGNTPGHPWAASKSESEMAHEARAVLAGYHVNGNLLHKLDRIARD